MNPNDVYPSDLLDRTKASFVPPSQQQNNVPRPDAPRFIPQDQDVDMEDAPPKAATATGQPFPLAPSPPQQLLPNPPNPQSGDIGRPRSPPAPWQPVQAPRYGYTSQQPAVGQKPLPVTQYHPLPNMPVLSEYPASMVLSTDPAYQHDLKPIVYHFGNHFVLNDVTHHAPMPGYEHVRKIEYNPMVYKSAAGETKVIWDVWVDGKYCWFSREPRLPFQTPDMGQQPV